MIAWQRRWHSASSISPRSSAASTSASSPQPPPMEARTLMRARRATPPPRPGASPRRPRPPRASPARWSRGRSCAPVERLPLRARKLRDDELVGVLDQPEQLLVVERAVEVDRVPVALREVVARTHGGVLLAQRLGQGRIALEADAGPVHGEDREHAAADPHDGRRLAKREVLGGARQAEAGGACGVTIEHRGQPTARPGGPPTRA